ncbi:ABC transporter permease subunit [Cohnella sp. CFH 77786]|uniref:ABC transporter permease n=1 Tax=Cohnella sp. CFH 77786 TaxID=2662265 RepID=UPI001C60EF0D|nr:ABC transporter permease subunit [Cohnella sp. CFH 77786]MBW5446165.1 ABC transporter permease subunit [Cohnella sp. CFH 77786]
MANPSIVRSASKRAHPERQSGIARLLRDIARNRVLLLMLLPPTILFFINCYIPMFGVLIAFKNINYVDGILGSPWAGLNNFRFLFATSDAWRVTVNTVGYNIAFIVSGLILSVTVAIAVNEVRAKLASRFYQTVMIMPNFLSMVVVSYIVYAFLHPEYGFLVKYILPVFGYSSVNAYMHPQAWPYILWLTKMWHSVGIGSVIYLASITGINEELYEAAVMDGASKWQQITRITLPLLTPVMVILTILNMGGIFRSDFGLFYHVTLDSGALRSTTDVIDTYVYRGLIQLGDLGMSSAANFYQSVVGFFLVIGANALARRLNRDTALF